MKQVFQILAVLLFLIPCISFGQPTNSILNDVVMPAPNAASLGQYADMPVNYSTGAPSIGIPIYTVKDGKLSVPISLSYHASGIRVGQPASWVGQGWSLNAGGMITRTVMGLPDEYGNGYYNSGSSLTQSDTEIEDVAEGDQDSEPDLFTFNVGGYTGKFVLDENNEPFLMPEQDIKIEVRYATNTFDGFTIIAPNGTKYIFGNLPGNTGLTAIERTHMAPNTQTSYLPHHSTWYLSRIESYDGIDYITFEYEEELYTYKSLASCSYTQALYFCSSLPYTDTNDNCQGYTDDGGKTYYNRISVSGKRLKEIRTPSSTETITFRVDTTNERTDLEEISTGSGLSVVDTNTAYPLEKINIKTGSYESEWEFSYTYFQTTSPGSNAENYRLKLDSVQHKPVSPSSSTIPPYTFHYEGTDLGGGNQFMPGRLSKAVDHWGYYNGQVGNQDYRGNAPPQVYTIDGQMYGYGQSVRIPDSASMVTGTLTQIDHPLGRSEYFTYEPHDYYTTFTDSESKLFLANCDEFEESCCSAADQISTYVFQNQEEIDDAEFELYLMVSDNVFCGTSDVTPPITPGCLSCSDLNLNHEVEIEVYDLDNSASVGSYSFNSVSAGDGSTGFVALSNIGSFSPGTRYRFTLSVLRGRGTFELITDYGTSGVSLNQTVGGLRIKEIRVAPDGTQGSDDIIRTFTYRDSLNPDQSSGVLRTIPYYKLSDEFQAGGNTGYYTVIQSNSQVPLGGFSGQHIAYKRVQESFNGNGEKDYKFSVEAGSSPATFPLIPSKFSARNETMDRSYTYREDGNLVQRSVQIPVTKTPSSMTGLAYKVKDTGVRCSVNTVIEPSLLDEDYTIYSSSYQLKKEISETDGLEVTTEYEYGNSNYQNVSRIITTNSDGTVARDTIRYAYDDSSGDPVYDTMVVLNMVNVPIQRTRGVDGELVSGTKTEYSYFVKGTNGVVSSSSFDNDFLYPL